MSLLKVTNLGKSFGGVKAVDGISFELPPGELLALIGPNGAGKSTTFNMVNGQLKADQGSITLDGHELVGRKPREIWRKGGGRTFQIAETFASLTVVENVQMALLSHDHKLFSMWRRAADHKRDEALALLDQVGMKAQADRPCSVLAYGDVKRVELAIAMANWPKLLLMDEPTAGMAPQERNSLMALTKDLVIQRGMAVLFTEHSMDVVFAYADRMIVLARGASRWKFATTRRCRRCTSAAARPSRRSPKRPPHWESPHEHARTASGSQGLVRLVRRRADPLRRRPRSAARRSRRAHGPQRRGQIDHAQDAHRHAEQAPRRRALPGPRHFQERAAPRGAPGPGLRARRPARVHRPHGEGEPRGRQAACAPVGRRHGRAAVDARAPVPAVPQPRRDAQPPRWPHERRRAADAHRGAHADGQPLPRAARRALRGRGPRHRRADGQHDPRAQGAGREHPAVGAEHALRRAGLRPRLRAREGADPLSRDDGRTGGQRRSAQGLPQRLTVSFPQPPESTPCIAEPS